MCLTGPRFLSPVLSAGTCASSSSDMSADRHVSCRLSTHCILLTQWSESMRRYLLAFIFVALPLATALGHAQRSSGSSSVDLAAVDRTADACTDFYQFACGGWIAANPVP